MKIRLSTATACILMAASSLAAAPLDDSISYQGRLTNSGSPVTGLADLTFSLWDSAAAGAQIGADIVLLNVPVADGLFNVDLDFGADMFSGNMRWLEIEARNPAGVGGYTLLTPRQELTSAPSALGLRLPLEQDGAVTDFDNLITLTNNGSGRIMQLLQSEPVAASSHVLRLDVDHTNTTAAQGIYATGGAAGLHITSDALGMSVTNNGDAFEAVQIYNFNVLNPASALLVNNYGTGPTILANAYNGGLALSAIGPVEIGDAGTDGSLLLYNNGVVGLTANSFFSYGVELRIKDEQGNTHTYIQPDADSAGGFFQVNRLENSPGFIVDGNYAGTSSPRVSISGNVSMSFDASTSGEFSVNLPTASIGSAETSNEPGVASAASNNFLNLTGAVDTILARTLFVPASGYCVVIGTCQANALHATGTTSYANFGVSDVSTSLPVNQDVAFFISGGAATATYEFPVTVHGTFSVTAGANTFYLLGDENNGNMSVNDPQLTVMYFPTAYGTVTSTLLARGGAGDDASAPQVLPMSAQDIDAERLQAIQFDIQRTRAELEQEVARMDRLEQELRQITSDQNAGGRSIPARRAAPPQPQAPLGAEPAFASPIAGTDQASNLQNSFSDSGRK